VLPAEIVKQVRRIQIETGRQVADVLAGAYVSVFKGRGMEFDEVRPYVPGDDIRTLDWNVTARTGMPYVKRYVEERQLSVLLLVDISASQEFGSGARSKRDAAVELSALVAFSAIENDDKVGLVLFHGAAETYIPPRKGQRHALRVIREVLAPGAPRGLAPGAAGPSWWNPFKLGQQMWRRLRRLQQVTREEPRRGTNIGHALEFCRRVLRRRAVVFLISDFLDEGYLAPLRSAHRRHDVVCVHVGDPREHSMPPAGLLTLEDAETGRLRVVDTDSAAMRQALAEGEAARLARLQAELGSSGIDLVRIDADRSVVEPLVAFLRMRKRRLRR